MVEYFTSKGRYFKRLPTGAVRFAKIPGDRPKSCPPCRPCDKRESGMKLSVKRKRSPTPKSKTPTKRKKPSIYAATPSDRVFPW